MHLKNILMPLGNKVLESQLHLTKREAQTLRKAEKVLKDIRERLLTIWGEDGAAETNEAAESLIWAHISLSSALDDLCSATWADGKQTNHIKFPPPPEEA